MLLEKLTDQNISLFLPSAVLKAESVPLQTASSSPSSGIRQIQFTTLFDQFALLSDFALPDGIVDFDLIKLIKLLQLFELVLVGA